jgi:acetyltransferase-like isoleucine patch superfamily enzyme
MNYFKKIILTQLRRVRVLLFYVLNKGKFKRLELKSLIMNPLRIEGKEYISLLSGAVIQSHAFLYAEKIDEYVPQIIIGKGSVLGNYNHIAAVRKIVFGEEVLTSDRVYISDNLHVFENVNVPIMHQPLKFKAEVSIGDGSWIGENVCIIGARIGKNCVIGANAVVTSDIPDYSVAVGIPARVIKKYDPQNKKWVKTAR